MSTRLVLIRHAESVANRMGFLGGHNACQGLTDDGRRQAAALRDRFAADPLPADALLTSLLPRAIETARILSPALAAGGLGVQSRCELCDVHWGDLDGAPVSAVPDWRDPYRPVAGGGESWVLFERRCQRVLRQLAKEFAGRTAVVVTHGGFVKASRRVFGGATYDESAAAEASYTGVTSWVDDGDGRWRLERYDDRSHLAGLSTVDAV